MISDGRAPLASVLFVAFQQARYVRAALRSVLFQTYQPLEILVSDDGSDDGTYEILKEEVGVYRGPHRVDLLPPHRRLRLHHFNYLMERARGDVCLIACGDDICAEDRVTVIVEAHRRTGASVVTSNCIVINEDSQIAGLIHDPVHDPDVSLATFLEHLTPMCHGASMSWTRELWDIFGPTDGQRNIDWIIPFRGLLLGGNHFERRPVVMYRLHAGNTALALLAAGTEGENLARVREVQAYQKVANIFAMRDAVERIAALRPDDARWPWLRQKLAENLWKESAAWVDCRAAVVANIGFY